MGILVFVYTGQASKPCFLVNGFLIFNIYKNIFCEGQERDSQIRHPYLFYIYMLLTFRL